MAIMMYCHNFILKTLISTAPQFDVHVLFYLSVLFIICDRVYSILIVHKNYLRSMLPDFFR